MRTLKGNLTLGLTPNFQPLREASRAGPQTPSFQINMAIPVDRAAKFKAGMNAKGFSHGHQFLVWLIDQVQFDQPPQP